MGNYFEDILEDVEPADPQGIDHSVRRQTRLAPSNFDAVNLPSRFVECGCRECPDAADPLAGNEHAFRDTVMAIDVCDNPRPMTLDRATKAYYRYERASQRSTERTSKLTSMKGQYRAVLESERALLTTDDWSDAVTTVLLSLRLSPIEPIEGDGNEGEKTEPDNTWPNSEIHTAADDTQYRWVPPVQLDNRLQDPWQATYDRLRYRLRSYEWEYLATVSATDSAATPHWHLYVWVHDGDDEITVKQFRPVVEAFVDGANGASMDHHPIDENADSGTIVIQHDPEYQEPDAMDKGEDQIVENHRREGEDGLHLNTAGLIYVMKQRPHWAMANVDDSDNNEYAGATWLERATVEMAATHNWVKSSNRINLKPSNSND